MELVRLTNRTVNIKWSDCEVVKWHEMDMLTKVFFTQMLLAALLYACSHQWCVNCLAKSWPICGEKQFFTHYMHANYNSYMVPVYKDGYCSGHACRLKHFLTTTQIVYISDTSIISKHVHLKGTSHPSSVKFQLRLNGSRNSIFIFSKSFTYRKRKYFINISTMR